ncbi:MAG: virulence-associated E family protein [Flavobacteriales bacterium]|nr:virulence-associated E family protein [Flavobacteriales bacterium]
MKENKSIYELKNQKSNTKYDEVIAFIEKNYELKYDIISQEYLIKSKSSASSDDFQELNINSFIITLSKANIDFAIDKLLILLNSSFINQVNPIIEYFESLSEWDSEDHISKLLSYVPVLDKEEFEYHFKKWIARVVKCALEPNFFNKQALILYSPNQSAGKTSFCRFLCPPELNKYFSEEISLDKDGRIQLCKNILINLEELQVLAKKEVNSLKSHFSKTQINERLPYGRKNTRLTRICSFIGSTNQTSFLTDETGSVRWLIFHVIDSLNFNYSNEVNIDRVWSQAYHLAYKEKSFNPELTLKDIEENEIRNKKYSSLTTEQELIAKYYDRSTDIAHFVTASDVLIKLNTLNLKLNQVNIGKAFSGFGYERTKHSTRQVYGYLAKCRFVDSPWEIENNIKK